MPYKDREKAKKYNNEYHKKYRTAKRVELIEYLGGKCVYCGNSENLQFDHVKPEDKSLNIGQILDFNNEKLYEEIDKCQLLCKKCHTIKHEAKHGTRSKYSEGCRCDSCRESGKKYRKEHREEIITYLIEYRKKKYEH